MQTLNREAYLNFITDTYIRDHFKAKGYTIPANVRMSCSLTSTKKAIGQCWSSLNSADNHFEIFVSPKVADSVEVIDILIHELVHATVGIKAGHKAPFKACAVAVGLEGKMTSASANAELKAIIQSWVDESGQYPHAPLTQSGIKKQSTRMLKCACSACGYQVYTSKKWIELALPVCPDSECEKYGSSMAQETTESNDE
jgi:SprT-like family